MGVFDPKCYKLHYDDNAVKLSTMLDCLAGMGSVIIYERELYIFLQNGLSQTDIKKALPEEVAENVYCQQMKAEHCMEQSNFVHMWFKEQYEKAFFEYVQKEKSGELQKIIDNVNKAKERIKQRIEEGKEAE